jgi:putative FmdB family regulatory protein
MLFLILFTTRPEKEVIMPIYEYRCNRCNQVFSLLFLSAQQAATAECTFCHERDVSRLLSSFSIHQTEASRLDAFDTSKRPSEDFYRDSRNVGLWTKKRMKELGVDLGSKLDDIVEKGRTGKILDDTNT